jgi:hypothetical protein
MNMNKERIQAIIDRIKADPQCHVQDTWHTGVSAKHPCGMAHCLGGWAQIDSGKPIDGTNVVKDARKWLQISHDDANWLFDRYRTIAEFEAFVSDYEGDGYNRAGYNRDGYDRDGLDINFKERGE